MFLLLMKMIKKAAFLNLNSQAAKLGDSRLDQLTPVIL
jgi:hypothetical protein